MTARTSRPPLGARVRVTPASDIDVLVGRVAVVVGHHVDGIASLVEMVDTGTRFVLEPAHLAVIEPTGGAPPYVPSGDHQPCRPRGTAT